MSGSTWNNVGSPTADTTSNVTGLTPDTQYDLEVIATNAAGSATSGVVTATTISGSAPSQVTGLAASAASSTSLTLSWNAATGLAPITYQPQFRLTGQTGWTNSGSPISGTSATITGLVSGSSYDLEVVATNSIGSSTSGILTTSTQGAGQAPAAPTGLAVISATANSISLAWSASAAGTTPISYQLQYRLTGQTSWTNFGSPGSTTSGTVSGLSVSTGYDFQVLASNAYGSAASSVVTGSTAAVSGTAPSSPTGLFVTALTPTTATLAWSASATGTAPITYQAQYRVRGAATWSIFGTSSSSLSATITGLQPATTYDFQVVASNASGSSASAINSAATPAAPNAPSAPGAPVAWIIMPNSVSLTWAASASGTAPITYQVQVRATGTTIWTPSGVPSQATSTTVEGLSAGTDYDFEVMASNTAGVSYSPILTILAPTTGGTVTTKAAFQPQQILRAADLDAILDAKLGTDGGAVGPLQITQSAAGGSQPAMLSLSRTAGGASDAPLISGSYIAVMSDGPVVGYSAIGMSVTVAGDSTGTGPAGNIWTLSGSTAINSLRSTSAPASGSVHTGVTGQVTKALPITGIPLGRRLADGIGIHATVIDGSNMPSSQSGGLTAVNGAMAVNGTDNSDLRYGARFVYGEALGITSNGLPAEVSRGLYVGSNSATTYAKTTIEVSGNYGVSAIDLRGATTYRSIVTSSTPTGPVSSLSVDRALVFSSAGSPALAVNASNPKAVTINGNAYSVVAVSQTSGSEGGILTFSSPVSVSDATQGTVIVPVSNHAIWLSEGVGNQQPGDIAFNSAGTSRIYYQTGSGFMVASGADPLRLQSTAAIVLPIGSTTQRPSSPSLGMLRANVDTNQYEVWQPSSSSWTALGSGGSTGGSPTSGTAPGPALAVVTGTPATTAVSLSWSAPLTGTTPFSYQVQYRITGTSGWVDWGGPQTTTSTTISGLTPNTRYDFEIVTSNAYGSSTSAIATTTTAAIAPSAPTGLAAGTLTSTTVALSWTASATGTTPFSYLVNYRVTGQTTWIANPAGATAGTSQTITGLTAATGYDFQVVASNAAGSAASSTITATTLTASTTAPSAPTAVAAGSPTSSSLTVSWSAPATGTTPFSYQVKYRVTGQTTFNAFGGSVTTTSVVVTGLSASTSYDFQVTATNSAGSATSATATAVTAATPPATTGTVSGSQQSGTTVPIIVGPASAAVLTSNVIPLTGITITDQAAATASGACTLKMTCTSGTVSSTVAGSQVSGSGTNSITYSNTLASCQTAAADLVYSAGSTAVSDNVVVTVTDQAGATSSITIAVAVTAPATGGGGGGSIPTDSTGTTAAVSQTVLNGFGVNTRIDTAGYQSLGLAVVENCINYLGGVKLMRDSTTTANDSTWFPQVCQATNARYIIYIAQMNSSNFDFTLNNAGISGQYIAAFEGCDEADTGQAVGFSETLALAATFQQTVWQAGQAYGCPVVQMSFGQGWQTNPNQGDYGAVGNQSAYATYGNIHFFPATSPQANNYLGNFGALAALATPGKPAAVTAFGYTQAASSAYNSCTPRTAAAYILEFIFDSFLLGYPYYFWLGLIDNVSGGGGAATGLFDDTGSPRPSATAVKNLFTLLSDGGGTFTPGKLNYTISNFPAISNGLGGRQVLMQKSDGSFWLALWNEQVLNSTTNGSDITVAAINITLTLGSSATSITVYDPSISTSVVGSVANSTSLAISLPARVILVKIVK